MVNRNYPPATQTAPSSTAAAAAPAALSSPMSELAARAKQQPDQATGPPSPQPRISEDPPVRHDSLLGEVDEAVNAIAADFPTGGPQSWEGLM